ncbi:MAG: hypothetical protein AAF718_05050 [Pseudomonadota bacterium]
MTALNLFTMISNVSTLVNELKEAGIFIEIGGDFAAFRRLRSSQTDRSAVFPMFDVASSYVDDTNAFWICGFDENKELIHTQAIRVLELGDATLSCHLRDHRHKYITPGSTPDADRTFFSALPSLDRISGRVGYHGEFWIKGGTIGRRNQGLTGVLSRIAFEMTMKLWSPDYMFAFVPTPLASRGVTVRYGYPHCEMGAWYGPEQEVTSEEFLVWMSNGDMETLLSATPRSLSDGIAVPERERVVRPVDMVA